MQIDWFLTKKYAGIHEDSFERDVINAQNPILYQKNNKQKELN